MTTSDVRSLRKSVAALDPVTVIWGSPRRQLVGIKPDFKVTAPMSHCLIVMVQSPPLLRAVEQWVKMMRQLLWGVRPSGCLQPSGNSRSKWIILEQ